MIRYFDFGFYKILPIMYETYVSDTEILNAIISRFNEFIKALNEQEKQLNDHLNDYNELKNDVIEVRNNIDGLYKKLDTTIKEVEKLIEKTKDDLQKEIDKNIKLLNDLINQFQIDYHNQLSQIKLMVANLEVKQNADFNLLNEKIDSEKKSLLKLISDNYLNLIRYTDRKISEINFNIEVINPITGSKQPLQTVINFLADWFGKGLSAFEYDHLYLTADEYDRLHLTAFHYDFYGIDRKELMLLYGYDPDAMKKQFDVYGNKRKNVISSVMQAFGNGVDSKINEWEITADQYSDFSSRYTAYELDRYGKFILSNHYPCMFNRPVFLTSDTIFVNNYGENEISFILKLPTDKDNVISLELLNEESMKKLFIDFNAELVIIPEKENRTFLHVTKVMYYFYNVKKELVDGGIAVNAKCWFDCRGLYQTLDGNNKVDDFLMIAIDPTALTTI